MVFEAFWSPLGHDWLPAEVGHDNSYFKDRSGREGMTVVSVLLGAAAVEVGVGSNPTIAKLKYIFISLSYNFSDVLVSEMILGWNICWSLYIFN